MWVVLELASTRKESLSLVGTPIGEDEYQYITDANAQKHGYRMGLETPVVHAVTYAC